MLQRAYLLAAGRGKRAGGPKAWLARDGVTLLERQLRFLAALLPPHRLSVSIQAGWEERCLALMPGARFIPVDPDAPAFAAFRALLADRPLKGWSSLHHVDMPVWETELFSLPTDDDHDAVVPVYGGLGGHPVLLHERLDAQLRALDAATGRLDHFLKSRAVLRRPTPHACAAENWNEAP